MLGGQWATSTVNKDHMFAEGCLGSIKGKGKDCYGTPCCCPCHCIIA